jgi:hypothetical protein
MIEPGRDLDHWWTAAILRIGDTHAVGGFAETYLGHERVSEGRRSLYVQFIVPKRVILHRDSASAE